MKVGDKYPQGTVYGDCWENIYETILTSTTTSVTISGLTGDTNKTYKLIMNVIPGTSSQYGLRLNNDTGSNYTYQLVFSQGASISVSRAGGDSYLWLGYAATNNVTQTTTILHAKKGDVRTAYTETTRDVNGTTITYNMFRGSMWTNTADEITSIVIYAFSGNLGPKTYIALYREVDKI